MAEEVKEHLRTIAESRAGRSADLDAFVDLVNLAASQYWATRSLQEEASPATVRGEIRAAHEALLRLTDRVNELGGTSRHLLYAEGPPGTNERFRDAIMFISEQLARARRDADELSSSGGAPRSYARTYLAALVAHAIETRLAVRATITSGGLFEDVLKTVIEALEKRPDPSVYDLMRGARSVRVSERPDGVIEIDPRSNNPPQKSGIIRPDVLLALPTFRAHEWRTQSEPHKRWSGPGRGKRPRSGPLS